MSGIKREACDKWFSDVVRRKANSTCEHCGIQGRMECAHIYGRANKAVRWSMDNAVSLCHYCHRTFTGNPVDFHLWLLDYLGQGHMDILIEKKNMILKTNKILRKEISDHYRGEFRKMEADQTYVPESYN
jgi:hypothetical protein